MYRWYLYIILFSQATLLLNGQEIHFSQINHPEILINPACTGHFTGNFRIGTGFRSQSKSVSIPYETFTAWGDYLHEFKKPERSSLGLGVFLYDDNAGEGSLHTTSGYITVSVIKGFNQDNSFKAALGFSVGIINRTINISRLVFDSQWNGTFFDPSISSGEPFSGNSLFAPDFNFGGLACWEISKNLQTSIGTSLMHINRPKLTFYEVENRLEHRLIVHGTAKHRINEWLQVNPGFYYSSQQGVDIMMFGANMLIIKENMKFLTGLWYRFERDIIPHLGVMAKNFLIEFSYDVNVSKLHLASNYHGGFEISLITIFSKKPSRYGCSDFTISKYMEPIQGF
ncbi:MAG TPA: PorP/SprF family type IX secretion system membrane protein [Bacteroidales bacterium]|nr:PorP/SprF family type IX secretion system membrane protein [Bacteroidales bacterium]